MLKTSLQSDLTVHHKKNEAMKQVAYVNYTLKKFKEFSQFLGDFMFVAISFILKIIFLFVFELSSTSWNNGFSRFLILKLHINLGLFLFVLEENSEKISIKFIKSQKLPNLQNLDVDSQISHFEWTLHNGRRKIHIGYRSDLKKLIEYRRNGNQWEDNQSLQLQSEEYDKLHDILPALLGYVETYKKSCIIIDECTV